jgi:hypothetical protein
VALEAGVAGEGPCCVSPLTATPPSRPVSGPMSCDLGYWWVQLEIGAMSVPSAEGHFPGIAARPADHAPLLPGFCLLAGFYPLWTRFPVASSFCSQNAIASIDNIALSAANPYSNLITYGASRFCMV